MPDIKINNLQPMAEYEELSDLELESVVGGIGPFAFVALFAAAACFLREKHEL